VDGDMVERVVSDCDTANSLCGAHRDDAQVGRLQSLRFSFGRRYYGTTFYVWALTTKLSRQKVSLRAIGEGEWYLVIGLLLINFILYIVLYPVRGVASAGAFFASILFAIVFGLLSPIYIRARRV
jgi:hypothetical protein